MTKIYISGPMTGLLGLNSHAFSAAQAALEHAGYTVVNPHANGLHREAPWEAHMRADIALLMGCDAVATLPGWQKSRGARIEVHLAQDLGIPTADWDAWLGRVSVRAA